MHLRCRCYFIRATARIADTHRRNAFSTSEQNDGVKSSLIPSTELLLESYHEMMPQERNTLLKEILYKIECRKEANGRIEINLFSRLSKL